MKIQKVNKDNIIFEVNGKSFKRQLSPTGIFWYSNERFQIDRSTNELVGLELETKAIENIVKFDINERFEHLSTFVDMTIERHVSSVVVCGDPGLGKSHTVLERLEAHGMVADKDYTVHKGYTTPKGLYNMLYENRNGIIVIDDMDSVFKDAVSLNLLKAALDSYSKRIVTWNSMGFIDDGLPNMFEFSGQIIFITNKSMNELDEAVKSRSLCVDVSMSTEEKMARMRAVANNILPEIKLSTKLNVLDFIDERKDAVKELNFRTFIKATKIYEATSNERAVEYMLMNS